MYGGSRALEPYERKGGVDQRERLGMADRKLSHSRMASTFAALHVVRGVRRIVPDGLFELRAELSTEPLSFHA
jgi:hypothetical protein